MGKPFHILVVDDDPIKLRALSRLYQAAGYDISEAALGSDCIRLAREKHPDIILLDVKLPDIDGVEVCRRLKADPELMTSLVIHLSAFRTSSDDQVDGLEAEADGYIIQPISN